MKQYFVKKALLAGVVLLAVPAFTFAQNDKEKIEKKEKKETQQIIIMRNGVTDKKTVIEINGDNVLVNGKKASESGDVTVHLNNLGDLNEMQFKALADQRHLNNLQLRNMDVEGDFNFDLNEDLNYNLNHDLNERVSLFTEDSNRAMLGVMTDEDDKGAKITSITSESAAAKAGLNVGDVITKIGNEDIDDADDVSKAVRKHKPGDKITVSVLRNGKEQKINAELGKWKGVRINNFNAVIPPAAPHAPEASYRSYSYSYGSGPKLGLSVQDTDDGKGVKVLEVAEESNAAKAGVKKDDVITHINGEQVDGTDDVVRSIRDNRNDASVKLQLLRGGKPQNIEVRIPRKLKTANL